METTVGLIAGFFLGVFADVVRQWLNRKTRREERSEKAAEDLIILLDEARDPFRDAYRLDAEVDDGEVRTRVMKVRQKAILLTDEGARKRIELVAEVLEDHLGAQEFTGDTFARIAWVAWNDGREAVRCFLDRKPIPPPSEDLVKFKGSIDQGHEIWEQQMKEEAERRRRSKSG